MVGGVGALLIAVIVLASRGGDAERPTDGGATLAKATFADNALTEITGQVRATWAPFGAELGKFHLPPDRDGSVALAHGDVVPGSLHLSVAGRRWSAGSEYRLRARSGEIIPLRDWSDEGMVTAIVEYRFQPGGIRTRVGVRPVAPPPPGSAGEVGGSDDVADS